MIYGFTSELFFLRSFGIIFGGSVKGRLAVDGDAGCAHPVIGHLAHSCHNFIASHLYHFGCSGHLVIPKKFQPLEFQNPLFGWACWRIFRLVDGYRHFRNFGYFSDWFDRADFLFERMVEKSQCTGTQTAQDHSRIVLGTLTGFTSFISHAGAPPFQVYVLPQKLSKADFAGTATLVFAVINLAKIIPYQDLRPYQFSDMTDAVQLIPFAIVGTYVGAILTKKIPDKLFFLWVQIGLFLISLKLIWSTSKEFFLTSNLSSFQI